jgi:CTP:molybdopterin cytidylyltransferase MocA
VLGAGAAKRFGSPKQLAMFRGRALITHPIDVLRQAGLNRICVVLGASADAVAPASPARRSFAVMAGPGVRATPSGRESWQQ